MKKLLITLDGPAGSGKSTTAKLLAKRLGYCYLDTGAMYRAITLQAIHHGIFPTDPEKIIAMLPDITLHIDYKDGRQQTFLNGWDVSEGIRSPEVTRHVSAVSAIAEVRTFLRQQQQHIGNQGGYVVDGRDIGTVVFPNADIKFYMTANVEERARRRLKEMADTDEWDLPKMIEDIQKRDHADMTRAEAPLRQPPDAIVIDNSLMTLDEQIQTIIAHIENRFGKQ